MNKKILEQFAMKKSRKEKNIENQIIYVWLWYALW